jgi:hypothetical protein
VVAGVQPDYTQQGQHQQQQSHMASCVWRHHQLHGLPATLQNYAQLLTPSGPDADRAAAAAADEDDDANP